MPKPGVTEATLKQTNEKVRAMIKNPPDGLVYSGHPVELLFTVEPDSNGKRGDLLLNYRVPFTSAPKQGETLPGPPGDSTPKE